MILFIKKLDSFNNKIIVEIDNNIKESLFEWDIDFSNYSTEIKTIAIYYPECLIEKNKSLYSYCNISTLKNKIIKNCNNLTIYELIISHINLAKNHGIYGFGINYYWFSGDKYFDEVINIFLERQEIHFPYFIIWKNDYLNINDRNGKNIIINQTYYLNNSLYFIQNIRKYLVSDNYLKINQKPVLAIYESKIIPYEYISHLRINAFKFGIGSIIIIGVSNEIENTNYSKLFDFIYEFPPKNIYSKELIRNDFFYYSDLIYKGNFKYEKNLLQNITIYKGIMLEPDSISNSNKKESIHFIGYSPEKFFLLNKLIINWTRQYHEKNDYYIFITVIFIIFHPKKNKIIYIKESINNIGKIKKYNKYYNNDKL